MTDTKIRIEPDTQYPVRVGGHEDTLTAEQLLALGRGGAAVSVFLDDEWKWLELVDGAWEPAARGWTIDNGADDSYEVDVAIHDHQEFVYVRPDTGADRYLLALRPQAALQLSRVLADAVTAVGGCPETGPRVADETPRAKRALNWTVEDPDCDSLDVKLLIDWPHLYIQLHHDGRDEVTATLSSVGARRLAQVLEVVADAADEFEDHHVGTIHGLTGGDGDR